MAELHRSGDAVHISLDEHEAGLLRSIVREMQQLLQDDATGEDPVLDRLFPDASESREEATAYKAMVGDELKTGKLEGLEIVLATLGDEGAVSEDISLDATERWMIALTDLRLAVGTRVGVTEEMMAAPLDPEDPQVAQLAVLHWLGWLQESLIGTLTSEGNR